MYVQSKTKGLGIRMDRHFNGWMDESLDSCSILMTLAIVPSVATFGRINPQVGEED
jgi:hypothetical protein